MTWQETDVGGADPRTPSALWESFSSRSRKKSNIRRRPTRRQAVYRRLLWEQWRFTFRRLILEH